MEAQFSAPRYAQRMLPNMAQLFMAIIRGYGGWPGSRMDCLRDRRHSRTQVCGRLSVLPDIVSRGRCNCAWRSEEDAYPEL